MKLERDENGITITPSWWVDTPSEPTPLEKALSAMFEANGFDAETATALTEEVHNVLNDGEYQVGRDWKQMMWFDWRPTP